VLLALAIPGHLIFLNIIAKLQAGHTTLTLIFTVVYLLVGFLQVSMISYYIERYYRYMQEYWSSILQ
jgi:solute carrier family 41